jgi:hypothetical protein
MSETTPRGPKAGVKRHAIYLVIITALLVSNIYFLADSRRQRQALSEIRGGYDTMRVEVMNMSEQRMALLERIDSLDDDLAVQYSLADQLDSLVDSLRFELQKKKDEIRRTQNLSKQELAALTQQLENTKAAYLAMIADLKTRLGIVEAENVELKDSIQKARAREQVLTAKVKTGEVMQANNDVQATGLTTKANGKEKDTDIAKNVEKIKVCFSFVENRLAGAGSKSVLLRVINPVGETMMVEALGGGEFTLADGDESLYTTRADIPYDPSEPNRTRCIIWTPQSELAPGDYRVELYHEGYLIGKTNMALKKGII